MESDGWKYYTQLAAVYNECMFFPEFTYYAMLKMIGEQDIGFVERCKNFFGVSKSYISRHYALYYLKICRLDHYATYRGFSERLTASRQPISREIVL
jgi:hypothetical protein